MHESSDLPLFSCIHLFHCSLFHQMDRLSRLLFFHYDFCFKNLLPFRCWDAMPMRAGYTLHMIIFHMHFFTTHSSWWRTLTQPHHNLSLIVLWITKNTNFLTQDCELFQSMLFPSENWLLCGSNNHFFPVSPNSFIFSIQSRISFVFSFVP